MSSIAVIDIGSTKALAAIAEMEPDGTARVIATGTAPCVGMKHGTVIDLDQAAHAVVTSVRKSEQMANRKIDAVILSVSGEHVKGSPSQGLVPILNPSKTISREDVHRVINHSKQIALEADRELILAVPRSYKVDGQTGVSKPFGMSGGRLEVNTLLVTGVSTHLENLEKCVNRAQIEVEQKVPQGLASSYAVLSQHEKEVGVAVIDIGGGTTDIAVFEEGSVSYIAMIPIGSNHITSDIGILLKTSAEEAERLKKEHADCNFEAIAESEPVEIMQAGATEKRHFSRRVLGEIVASRAREIIALAVEQIETHAPLARLGAGLVLSGGGANLKGLVELTERSFDTSARIGKPERLPGLGDTLSGPEHAATVGLIKYGLRNREEEAVAAESGDWRKVLRSIGSIFSPRSREETS